MAAAEQDIAALKQQRKALQGTVRQIQAGEKVWVDLGHNPARKNADEGHQGHYGGTDEGAEGRKRRWRPWTASPLG